MDGIGVVVNLTVESVVKFCTASELDSEQRRARVERGDK